MSKILLLSGGIDSTTLLAKLSAECRHYGTKLHSLIFDYGQTLIKEVDIARRNAVHYGALPVIFKVDFTALAPRCALLQGNEDNIPTGRSTDDIAQAGTPPTYVPFRNGIFLAYAVAYGEYHGIEDIYCGGNGLHSGNYWDDTAHFALAFTTAAQIGTAPEYGPVIHFPFSTITKQQIVQQGRQLGVDYTLTWSCYLNQQQPCGVCDSCVQRQQALAEESEHVRS